MVKIYVRRIKAGALKWTDVPPSYRNKVKAELVKQGYTCNPDGTVTDPDGNVVELIDTLSLDDTVAE